MEESQTQDATFIAGADAYRAGHGLAMNPHRGTELSERWRQGWLSAESRQIQTGIFGALDMLNNAMRRGPHRSDSNSIDGLSAVASPESGRAA
jgi:hypothetical protein